MQALNLMDKPLNQADSNKSDHTNQSKLQFLLISVSLIGINFGLMVFVGMYWLNPSFHTFLTGKPF